nr:reverse transcriptase domain-containing protein [Tanacetum cinerariifolium]
MNLKIKFNVHICSCKEEGRKELCGLLRRHLDVFAWKLAHMTGVPRHIAEHRLNVREGCLHVRQKKKGHEPGRNKAIGEEKCTKKSDFQWTAKEEMAFKGMKQLIAELLVNGTKGKRGVDYVSGSCKRSHQRSLDDRKGREARMEFTYALRFIFNATNNEAEYEALIACLRIAGQIGVQNLQANVDSKLVANQ